MGNLLAAVLFLVGNSALACPNLTGHWVCGPGYGINISQSTGEDGVETYEVGDFSIRADGVWDEKSSVEDGLEELSKIRGLCTEDAKLQWNVYRTISFEAEHKFTIDMFREFWVDDSGRLVRETKGYRQMSDEKSVLDSTTICEKG